MTPEQQIRPATARKFGAAVRRILKELGLNWKVQCKTVSFHGFGYGASPFADIQTDRRLTYIECSALADTVRALRADPEGGRGIIELKGPDYAFGGAIGYKDYPSGAEFWKQLRSDLIDTPENERKVTAVIREAERRALLAYRAEMAGRPRRETLRQDWWCKAWIDSGMANAEDWGACWPEIYEPEEMPAGWPGIKAFEGQEVKP